MVAPFAGMRLRRRRPDLPRPIATDYAGASLVAALTVLLLVLGLVHRPAVADHRADDRAVIDAVGAYVATSAPAWTPGALRASTRASSRGTCTAPASPGPTRAAGCA